MLFDKVKDGVSGLLKAHADRASGSYCVKHLGSEAFKKMRAFRLIAPGDILQAGLLEKSVERIFSRKAEVFGKETDLTYRIKKRGWQVLPETISPDPAGKFMPRVVNKSNLEHALSIWHLLYRINPQYVPIDWHLDFLSDYRFESTTHSRNVNTTPKPGVHIVSAFTFGRLYHLTWMALLFTASEKEAYAQEILCELLDFMSLNPPCFGIHWSAPEEVAVRTANMVICVCLIKEWLMKQPYGDECGRELLKYLYSCGEYLYAGQKEGETESFSDVFSLAALLAVSSAVEAVFEEAKTWQLAAYEALKLRIPRYIAGDGTNPEASTCLHLYATEALSFAVCFYCTQKEGTVDKAVIVKTFGEAFFDCFYKMAQALFFLMKPNGTLPQIGDNPSLHFFKLNTSLTLQVYPLLYLCSLLCEEPSWAVPDFSRKEDALTDCAFLLGKERSFSSGTFNGASVADIPTRAFRESGWYILRHRNNYCAVSAGNLGKSEHRCFAHNDKLSFELCLAGEDVVVDPGTYTFYDTKERNAFRGTASHATVIVWGEEQNALDSGMFSMVHRTRCKVLDFGEDEESIWFEAEQYGYKGAGFVHRRRIEFLKAKAELSVKDILMGNTSRARYLNSAILNPFLDVLRLDIKAEGSINITDRGWYSPEYGIKIPAKRMETAALSYTISSIR